MRRRTEYARRALVASSALVTGAAMATAEWFGGAGPGSRHPEIVLRWYEQHASVLEWRALLLAVAAVGVVAFAASFRELTWAIVPERLWPGTVMVLASLGYAALTSVAAALDLAVVWSLPSGRLDAGVVALAALVYRLLLVVATPAVVVVLLGASLPFARLSTGGQVAAVLAVMISVVLAIPAAWYLGRYAIAGWFLLAAGVVAWPAAPGASVRAIAESRRQEANRSDGGLAAAG